MKSKDFLPEMTMRGPNFDKMAADFGRYKSEIWHSDGQYIADIEQFKVIKYDNYYSLWSSDQLVGYASLIDSVVDNIWVRDENRGQKIFSKLLWFFKTRLNVSPLILGKIHSQTMQEVVKGLSYFNKSWINVDTKEVAKFDLDTLDNFYSGHRVTPWRVMLENDGDFSDWPRFTDGQSFVYESYEPYVN